MKCDPVVVCLPQCLETMLNKLTVQANSNVLTCEELLSFIITAALNLYTGSFNHRHCSELRCAEGKALYRSLLNLNANLLSC